MKGVREDEQLLSPPSSDCGGLKELLQQQTDTPTMQGGATTGPSFPCGIMKTLSDGETVPH